MTQAAWALAEVAPEACDAIRDTGALETLAWLLERGLDADAAFAAIALFSLFVSGRPEIADQFADARGAEALLEACKRQCQMVASHALTVLQALATASPATVGRRLMRQDAVEAPVVALRSNPSVVVAEAAQALARLAFGGLHSATAKLETLRSLVN